MTTPLFPFPSPPYYIVSPPFTEKSAGVKVLHMLCHALNVSGHRAYMVEMNIPPQGGETYCSDFIAPLLTPEADRYYASQRIDPIYVYPDIAYGNPFNAKRVVRWLLAPVSTAFPASDKIWAYSTGIALSAGTANILTCPAADPRQFVPLPGVKRRGTCFYAHKHRIAGGTLTADVSGSTEITRQMPRGHDQAPPAQRTVLCLRRYVSHHGGHSLRLPGGVAAQRPLPGELCPKGFYQQRRRLEK